MKIDYEAAKRMEEFAKEILRQAPAMQVKQSKNLLENSFIRSFIHHE